MFEQLVIQQTPVAVQTYTQTYFEGPKTANPIQERRAPVLSATIPRTLEVPIAARKIGGTASLADISDRRHFSSIDDGTKDFASADPLLDRTRNDRVTLLAQKYAGKIDNEGSARLQILTERLNRLVPIVEASTIDRVAEIVEVAFRPNPRIVGLKEKYKI